MIRKLHQVSGRDTATALANYCGPVKARPQHREPRALLITNSVWVLLLASSTGSHECWRQFLIRARCQDSYFTTLLYFRVPYRATSCVNIIWQAKHEKGTLSLKKIEAETGTT